MGGWIARTVWPAGSTFYSSRPPVEEGRRPWQADRASCIIGIEITQCAKPPIESWVSTGSVSCS
ncbi:uncharacterized protein TRAVEDRAFT_61434 [Trametes versicolor FP-101664 SS1]|uniref:Uncharacterized protein n=1 Tax=Trametes versicolor (strain FP-101664) TaxID=717944 RepID=R7S7Q3_TRAVS|nr:uncharacterized protein TRAVEDRAFT_61434 [Trametes versicolor FP-101664 SS1]EIW51700.1 hypothetical protein TRAVEDRAFT_61434 [Trametes versicolor FP-101664 SS1]